MEFEIWDLRFGIWDLEFGIWNFADCTAFLQKNFIFFEEKEIYLGEDIVKQSFVYLYDYVVDTKVCFVCILVVCYLLTNSVNQKSMKKLIQNKLGLAYNAITSFEFALVKNDSFLDIALEESSLYVISQRPIITFENVFFFESNLFFEIHQRGNENILKGKLPLMQNELGFTKKDTIALALNFLDKNNFKRNQPFNDLYGFSLVKQDANNPKIIIWFSPEKLMFNWWKGKIKCDIEGDFKSFLKYKVHYVGKATKQSILKRLTGHSTFQDILSLQNPITYKDLPSHEISILCFKFDDNIEISIFGENSSSEDMIKSINGKNFPKQEIFFLDAEKALIQAMKPKYNKELFKKYPQSKDGLYLHKYDYISYTFIDPITLIYDEGEINGGIDFDGGDIIEIKNNKESILVKR